MKVTLRQRTKGEKTSLYLDYYHKGQRQFEYLQLYLVPEPEKGKLTKSQREENRKNLDLAESIRSKRHHELQNGIYGFQDQGKLKGSFIKYMEILSEKRNESKGNHNNWVSSLKHVKKFVQSDIAFSQIDKLWLENFKEYLIHTARTRAEQPLSQNSASSYFKKVCAAINQAFRDGILNRNPVFDISGIRTVESEREFLTLQELQDLAKTECEIPLLKQAFLFSALTGLRWSDIFKMTWSEVQHSTEMGYYLRFTQKKTKGTETQPISDQARVLLGDRGTADARVFAGLTYSVWHNQLLKHWVLKAKITKNITFHCARHTYATLQLTLGTDIYTVSKLLGHKDLKTTQIYAKIIDDKKRIAANIITL